MAIMSTQFTVAPNKLSSQPLQLFPLHTKVNVLAVAIFFFLLQDRLIAFVVRSAARS